MRTDRANKWLTEWIWEGNREYRFSCAQKKCQMEQEEIRDSVLPVFISLIQQVTHTFLDKCTFLSNIATSTEFVRQHIHNQYSQKHSLVFGLQVQHHHTGAGTGQKFYWVEICLQITNMFRNWVLHFGPTAQWTTVSPYNKHKIYITEVENIMKIVLHVIKNS